MKNQTAITEDLKKIIAENYSKFKKDVKTGFIVKIILLAISIVFTAYMGYVCFGPILIPPIYNTIADIAMYLTLFQIFNVCISRRSTYNRKLKRTIKKELQVKLSYGEFKALEKSGEAERWASEYEAHEAAMMPTYKRAFAAEYEMYKKTLKTTRMVYLIVLAVFLIPTVIILCKAIMPYDPYFNPSYIMPLVLLAPLVIFMSVFTLYMPIYYFKKITDRFTYSEFRKMEKSGEMAKLVEELNCKNNISEIAE